VGLFGRFDRKLSVGGVLGGVSTLEVVMRSPEVFVRQLSHEEALRLKRLAKRATHESARERAASLLARRSSSLQAVGENLYCYRYSSYGVEHQGSRCR
jgi:hypothetical protein